MPDILPHGRLLSRREAVRLLGGGIAWLIGGGILPGRAVANGSSPLCLFRPEQTEGPYFVDERLHRSDIRSDPATGKLRPGVSFALTVVLSSVDRRECRPLSGAQVDIWHCDASGLYSDVNDPSFNTTGSKFLRGYQLTDGKGEARFLTIYPGWYPGRTVHIHIKVRTAVQGKGTFEFTSQIYFQDVFTDRIHAAPPYTANGRRTARNEDDRIFRRGGDRLIVAPEQSGDGYAASFAAGLQMPAG
jgi:protocatechuate 3,4-dioxygenase beta subunit